MALFEFGDYSYQEITLKEKLLEVLSYLLRIGDFKQYAGKTIENRGCRKHHTCRQLCRIF